ncbi:MAG: ABC transporter ATP-binding protein [Eubacteriales bacterium]|nr:ABC transporter ATP-binding protein [Eubacteriales bacterium]
MKQSKEQSLFKRLKSYMGERSILFNLSLVLAGISAVTGVLPFLYIHRVIKALLSTEGLRDWAVVSHSAWIALVFSLLTVILYFVALILSHVAAFRLENELQRQAMHEIFKQPLAFFSKYPSGYLRKTVREAGAVTHSFIAHNLPDMAQAFVSPFVLLALMFYIDWRLALASFIPLGIGMITMLMLTNTGEAKQLSEAYFASLQEMSTGAVEYVRAIPVVKTFGQSVRSFDKFYNSIMNYRDLVMKYTLSWGNGYTIYTVMMEAAAFFMVPLAVFLIGRGENLGQVLSDYIFYLIVAPLFSGSMMRLMQVANNRAKLNSTIESFDRLFADGVLAEAENPIKPEEYSLSFENVTFGYSPDRPVVENISFEIKEGESVGLVGVSGGGKTSIARLAARFWDPDEGEIKIGGVNLKQIGKAELMKDIAFAFQNSKLFKGTIRENILFAKPEASPEEVDRAIEQSSSREIINKLPEGLDTVIGSEGTYLSGGEQQRIALARAILKDAPIVLLDEATAFADPENEFLISKALRELRQGKTSLVIAHRLSSVEDLDRILVVDNGRIVQAGTHQDLLAVEGPYQKLWLEYQKSLQRQIKQEAAHA